MIGLLSSPGAVLAADEAAARRAAAPMPEGRPDATPVDAVHAVEPTQESASTSARHHDTQELTTDERLRQDEALHAQEDRAAGNEDVQLEDSARPDPDTTIARMRQVRREALAADDPAAQDRSVASKAAQVIRAAEAELAAQRHETLQRAAEELAQARDAAIVDEQERAAAEQGNAALGEPPPPAAHRVSEYQRQAVISAGSRLSSIPPPPSRLDESI